MKIVSVISDPTIELEKLTVPDTDYSTGTPVKTEDLDTLKYGYTSPLIKILGYIVPNISYFKVVSGVDFLPSLTLTFTDLNSEFRNKYFPKDGDLLSLYIRSKNPDFKHIRGDYNILTVKEYGSQITITAELRVEGIHIPTLKSYKEMSSFGVFKEVAKELGLGVSSNIEGDTQDKMTWICPLKSPYDFLSANVLEHAYLGEDKYFTSSIDLHYYLNFIEPSSIHSDLTVKEMRKITNILQTEDHHFGNGGKEDEGVLEEFFLSNHSYLLGTNKRIEEVNLLNSSSSISTSIGHRQVVFYYNKKEKKIEEFFHETITSKDENAIILKGRKEDDHTKNVRYLNKWLQSENVHINYNFSELSNRSNNRENGKITLRVVLSGICTEVNLYQLVPILLFNSGDSILNYGDDALKGNGYSQESINTLYSGNYMISGLGYEYNPSERPGIRTILMCVKREFIKIAQDEKSGQSPKK